jgi:CBS domain-containing protein
MATRRQQGAEPGATSGPAEGESYGVQLGWTVFDSMERPIGNVADAEGGVLRIDGRPQGHGFFDVPTSAIRRAEDSHVYLNRKLEDLFTLPAGADAAGAAGQASTRTTPEQGSAGTSAWEPSTPRVPASPAVSQAYSAAPATGTSGAGLTSHQPYAAQPSYAYPTEEDGHEAPASRLGAMVSAAGLAAALGGGLVWWRRRQARKSRMERIRRALLGSVALAAPLARTALERGDARMLTPLAALPLLLLARKAAGHEQAAPMPTQSALPARPDLHLADRLAALRAELPAALPSSAPSVPSRMLKLGAPALGAGALAFMLARRKANHSGGVSSSSRLGDIMTRQVEVVRPDQTIFEATTLMKRLNVGFLPVCDGRRLQGVLTDRDIVVRPIADSRDPQQATVRDAMSSEVIYAFEDDRIERGAELMKEHQIRRLPIVDRAKNLVGVVSLGDLAVDTGNRKLSGSTIERISEPSRPRR